MLLEKLFEFCTNTFPRLCSVSNKPAQPVFENQLSRFSDQLSRFLDCSTFLLCQSALSASSFLKTSLAVFRPAQPVLTPVHPPAEPITESKNLLAETGLAGFRTNSTGSWSKRSNGHQLLGAPLYTPLLSLSLSSFTPAHPRILG
jgi:hypothetical protein